MTQLDSSNSYVTLIDANGYFTNQLGAEAWTSADEDTRAKALVSATRILEELSYSGRVMDVAQVLGWPRVAQYFDPRTGRLQVTTADVVPNRIKFACYEQALHILQNPEVLQDNARVESVGVSTVNITNIRPAPRIPMRVKNFLKPLLVNGTQNWFRSN